MSYDLTFINGTRSRVLIAIKFKQESCRQYGNRPWGTRGWFILNGLDDEKTVLRNNNNRYFYYYAKSDAGRVWQGDSQCPVTSRAFDSCVGIGSTDAYDVFMRMRDFEVSERWRLT
jgi:uncharacterized membrane protein